MGFGLPSELFCAMHSDFRPILSPPVDTSSSGPGIPCIKRGLKAGPEAMQSEARNRPSNAGDRRLPVPKVIRTPYRRPGAYSGRRRVRRRTIDP